MTTSPPGSASTAAVTCSRHPPVTASCAYRAAAGELAAKITCEQLVRRRPRGHVGLTEIYGARAQSAPVLCHSSGRSVSCDEKTWSCDLSFDLATAERPLAIRVFHPLVHFTPSLVHRIAGHARRFGNGRLPAPPKTSSNREGDDAACTSSAPCRSNCSTARSVGPRSSCRSPSPSGSDICKSRAPPQLTRLPSHCRNLRHSTKRPSRLDSYKSGSKNGFKVSWPSGGQFPTNLLFRFPRWTLIGRDVPSECSCFGGRTRCANWPVI